MSDTEIIIIVAHGSRAEERGSVEKVAERLHRMIHVECGGDCVRTAYLQFNEPSVTDAIKRAVGDGANKIIIHPYFISRGVHVTKSIPEIISEAKASYPDVKFLYTEPLGPDDGLAEIVLKKIRAAKENE